MTTLNADQLNELEVRMRDLDVASLSRIILIAGKKIPFDGHFAFVASGEYDIGVLVFGTFDAATAVVEHLTNDE